MNNIQEVFKSENDFSVEVGDKKTRLSMRELIEKFTKSFQKEIGSETGSLDEINKKGLIENFVGGAYIRQLFIPADTIMVSQLWNKDRFWIITEGSVTITSELGRETIVAPYYGLAPFGTRVALHTHEDTMWFAITGAKAENPEDVEKELIVKSHSELNYPWERIEEGEL